MLQLDVGGEVGPLLEHGATLLAFVFRNVQQRLVGMHPLKVPPKILQFIETFFHHVTVFHPVKELTSVKNIKPSMRVKIWKPRWKMYNTDTFLAVVIYICIYHSSFIT